MPDFVHLHLHTQYSVLDGAIKIPQLIARAKELGHQAVGMTDHGNMHGVMEFYHEAKAREIKPIIGCEVYTTAGSRHEKQQKPQGGQGINHLTLLARNVTGYRNLCKLVSLGFIEGFYFKPRIDFEILSELNEGLICLSGCLSSEFASYSKRDDIESARDFIKRYQKIFGERYFLEVQPHAIREQQHLNSFARQLGDECGIPLVATNDCHYLAADDHHAQEVLMCISTGKLISDADRMRHDDAHLHFKSADEMLNELPDFEDAISHSADIAKSCELEFDFSTYHMPCFDPPKGKTLEELFVAETKVGLEERLLEFKRRDLPFEHEEYDARLEEEIELILKMGFAGYFLVVSDFIRWAKDNDIPVGPGRGSAAGSLVAYVLRITDIDPISNRLFFERFLNPERISLPDIDVDFCIFGRDRVIDYVCERYGKDKVAQIVTFGTLKAKAAIKDVGRVLGLSFAETDRIAKLIPAPRQGFDYPIAEALKMEKRLKQYADGEGQELISLAQKLEGLSRHTSTHAAGIVIADRPVVEHLPLMLDKDGHVITQFSMNWVEKIGLVKFDFLGLKTLTVLHRAVRMIEEGEGVKVDLNSLPLDDEATYKLIGSGKTIGVFQLESSGITEMVSRMKPSTFEDLVAILALYRPGPLDAGMVDHYINRKHGREPVRNVHPILEPILKDTYGIILYQEQIMQIAREMAGYSLGEADILRRAMGKKKPEEMAKQRKVFVSNSIERGIDEDVATEVFNQMETFARYGFNRSHSVAYAMISYQTAYLKAHYPVYFLASLMTLEMSDTDKTLKNLSECREMGIEVAAPNVNQGDVGFRVVDKKIVFGLAAIKGVGQKAVERILEIRRDGEFLSLLDFCKRADSNLVNRRMMEGFIKSGAFDWVDMSRAELIERLDEVLKSAQKSRADSMSNQMSLFGDETLSVKDDVYQVRRDLMPEWPTNVRLAYEKDALGFYLSGHPLEKYSEDLKQLGLQDISAIKKSADGSQVHAAGVVTFLKLKNTKKGDRYATFSLEDWRDTIEVIVWPDTYQKVHNLLVAEDPVLVTARLDVSDERSNLIAKEVESIIAVRDKSATEARVLLRSDCSEDKLESLKTLFAEHRGKCPVKLIVRRPGHSETIIALPSEIQVAPSESLCDKAEQLFGEPVISFR